MTKQKENKFKNKITHKSEALHKALNTCKCINHLINPDTLLHRLSGWKLSDC